METQTAPSPSDSRWRPRLVLLWGALLLAVALVLAPRWLHSRPPSHVFVFVFDALRADHLSQYGYPLPTSPGLDALARVSTLFERAYAPSSYTTASTASLFTGLAPQRHGALRQGAKLPTEHETVAEILHERGYAARGVSFNPVVADSTGFTQGFVDFVEREHGSPFNLYPDIEQGLQRIRTWLDAHPDQRQLVYFQVMNTHGPYLVPESAADALLGRPPRPEFQYYRSPMGEILSGDVARRAEVTPAYVESAVERYDTAIRYATDRLGRFLDELRDRGIFDSSIIVVTADHGDEFFEHGGFSHGYTLHEEVVRVPLLVKLPRQREARRVARPVSLMDVLPTLAEAVQASTPEVKAKVKELDGRSLMPLIAAAGEPEASAPRPLYLSADFPPRLVGRALVDGRHKLIAIERSYEGFERQLHLYDLQADPREQRDLGPSQPQLAQSLLARLLRHVEQTQPRAAAPASVASELDREKLRALGYVE